MNNSCDKPSKEIEWVSLEDFVKKAVEHCKVNDCENCQFKSFPSACATVLNYRLYGMYGNCV